MAIVTFVCDNGANINSALKQKFDTVKDLKYDEGEWESLSEDEKYSAVESWANEHLEIYFEEE